MTRFQMRIDPAWKPLLFPFGGTDKRSYAEVTDDVVSFNFGRFHRNVSRDQVEDALRRPWPWWMGIGWRTDFRGLVGLIGSSMGVVEVRLRVPTDPWGPFPCKRIAISLDDPDGFLDAITQSHAPPPQKSAVKKRPGASPGPRRSSTARAVRPRKRGTQS